jgi:DNA invertase Pin-like site-specific DNA recombinase
VPDFNVSEHRFRYTGDMLIGYARVSTLDQNPEGQFDQLEAAGVDRRYVFVDRVSGTLASRPEFDTAMKTIREGDVLVCTKLDRLARSVKHLVQIAEDLKKVGAHLRVLDQAIDTSTATGRMLFHMLAAIAEFEHELVVERTHAGLAAARARGRKGGRRPKMTPQKLATARQMYDSKQHTMAVIADTVGVSRATLYRHLEQSA